MKKTKAMFSASFILKHKKINNTTSGALSLRKLLSRPNLERYNKAKNTGAVETTMLGIHT
jgi:hypothetical protein